MASITERQGKYLVRVRRDGFASVAKTFIKRADGVAWGRRVEADMEAGRWVDEAKRVPTLKAAVAAYREAVAPRMKGAADYAYTFDELERLPFASKPIDNVTPFDLAGWRDEQAKTRKPGTVVRKLATLSGVFTWAMRERGWLDRNPCTLITKPRIDDARDRLLTALERQYLLAAAETSKAAAWLPALLTLLMHSAMRRGEAFGLKRGDIDFDRSTCHLADTKNGSSRDVPLCPRSLAALRQLDEAAAARGADALLPVGAVGSLSTRFAVTVVRARRAYEEDCKATGTTWDPTFLADVRLHDMRHEAASMWANTGALSLADLQAITGHRAVRMVGRYAHLNASKLATRLAALSV